MNDDEWSIVCDMCEVTYPHLHIRPMDEVLGYLSSDAGAWGGKYGRDCLEGKYRDTAQIQALSTIIERDGYAPGFGVAVREPGEPRPFPWAEPFDRPYIHDGHHRMTVMYYMGAQRCPIGRTASHARDTESYHQEKESLYKRRRLVSLDSEPAW